MKKLLLTATFSSALFLAACGGAEEESGNATPQPEGEKIVMQTCASCHGGQLQGMRKTPALNDVGARLSEEEILNVILNGTSNGMPGGLIKGEDAEKAAAWLAEQK
ncbi:MULTISPECIES: cytochrome c [Bacillales]|uniref:Cytochrome c n=1 Tax=Lysinibacillus louembei TaxID=1470088 RepID=A0ABZ0S2K2_9BACI|nr:MULTISPECIES: cytochrome c [Bacillales]MCT6924627.1 cytochrome c [Metasolibacillus sp.]MCT6940829.1 cytochrome c [Metasolibacillus sp.]WPK13912.1 cytochrome c [Lysinibacillus louembei]